jgi:hypothetical protein
MIAFWQGRTAVDFLTFAAAFGALLTSGIADDV